MKHRKIEQTDKKNNPLTISGLYKFCGDYRTRTGHLDTASVAL